MSLVCPQCGEQNPDEEKMCGMCGIVLPKAAIATQSIPPSPIPMQQPMTRPMNGYGAGIPYTVVYAGFWLRFVAAFIDGILIMVVSRTVSAIVGIFFGVATVASGASQTSPTGGALVISLMISYTIHWLYYAFMESSPAQGTLGKMALGLKVTDLDGQPIAFGRASGRYFGRLVSLLTLLIGYIMAGFTEKKQALHDIMASCLVVRK